MSCINTAALSAGSGSQIGGSDQASPAHEVGDQDLACWVFIGPVLGVKLGADHAAFIADGELDWRDFSSGEDLETGWWFGDV